MSEDFEQIKNKILEKMEPLEQEVMRAYNKGASEGRGNDLFRDLKKDFNLTRKQISAIILKRGELLSEYMNAPKPIIPKEELLAMTDTDFDWYIFWETRRYLMKINPTCRFTKENLELLPPMLRYFMATVFFEVESAGADVASYLGGMGLMRGDKHISLAQESYAYFGMKDVVDFISRLRTSINSEDIKKGRQALRKWRSEKEEDVAEIDKFLNKLDAFNQEWDLLSKITDANTNRLRETRVKFLRDHIDEFYRELEQLPELIKGY